MQTVAMYKTMSKEAVRPLGLCQTLIKTFSKEEAREAKLVVREYLEPQQTILSPGGAAKLLFTVRAVLEARRDFVCVPLDIINAYNEIAWAAIVENFEAVPSIQHLAQFFGVMLAPVGILEVSGREWGEAEEGAT